MTARQYRGRDRNPISDTSRDRGPLHWWELPTGSGVSNRCNLLIREMLGNNSGAITALWVMRITWMTPAPM